MKKKTIIAALTSDIFIVFDLIFLHTVTNEGQWELGSWHSHAPGFGMMRTSTRSLIWDAENVHTMIDLECWERPLGD